ncbi:hypothetical protein MRX96_054973 [Rhipicephalus microplus]
MAATIAALLTIYLSCYPCHSSALTAANGKAAVQHVAPKGGHPGAKPAPSRHTVVVVRGRPAAHGQPQYDYWRPWYTYDTPKQHHGRKDVHRPVPNYSPQAHKQPHPQHWSANRRMEGGRGDKAKVGYVKELKPVAYNTVIEEEKRVVIKEQPKLVLKKVPKVVVKEQPKVIIREQP